jgi:predicted nucleic acid-binding Zn ribbon protein
MPPTTAAGTYHVRAEVSPDVQQQLLQEQAQRQLKGERISLMAIAAEWLEEAAKQKQCASV